MNYFVAEEIGTFSSFATSSSSLFAEHSLSVSTITARLHCYILSLRGYSSSRLTYSEIMSRLGLSNSSEVESVVISCVMSGRLDAKMDQENETVLIRRAVASIKFNDKNNWQQLADKLNHWRQNVRVVLETLGQHEQQHIQHDEEEL